ncbi:hypothetical protein ACQEVY_40225 [Streptomyces sp. CA-288835]|uniref:hypothetical protein n=1 Tax=Streptomyces sp. CA-288835 TaxID=3240069 RepID=UPI003D8FFC4C
MESDDEDLVGEGSLTAEEEAELVDLIQDLIGLMLSVRIEAEPPVPGVAERLARQIRMGIGEPDCRIQVSDDGADAVLGPMRLDADDSAGALRSAMITLGGSWGDVVNITTSTDPVHYANRAAVDGPDEAGVARIHLWAANAWDLARYIEEHS